MKKVFSLVFSLVLAFSLAPVVFAHPGGTDSSGGHTDRLTGGYHYHHGYSAHQHEDLDGDGDLDCPYDYDDKTGQNSGSTYRSSYSSSTPAPTYTPRPLPTATPVPNEKVEAPSFSDVLKGLLLGFSPFVGVFIIVQIVKSKKARKRKTLEDAECKRKEHEQWLAEKAEYTKQFGGKPLLELAGAPSGCFVADDGLPAAPGTERWGYGYTFYVTYSGKAFHNSSCRYGQGCIPENAYNLSRWSDKHPCCYCRPKLPDLSWYQEYLRIKAIKEKYQID